MQAACSTVRILLGVLGVGARMHSKYSSVNIGLGRQMQLQKRRLI